MLGDLLRSPRVRSAARSVPGLSRSYWRAREELLLRRGVASLDYAPSRIRVHVDSPAVVRLRLRVVEKEPWTVEWLERNLRSGDVLYDIGANVGAYSLIAARICPQARTVAVEPAPANYEALCRNLVLNRATDAVTALPVGLAAATHLGSIALSDAVPGGADHVVDGVGDARGAVLAYALDDLVAAFALPAPTLMKIDVDGGEDAVLAGASATLADPRLRSLIVEVDVAKTEPVVTTLEGHGFSLTQRVDERLGQPLPGVWYGVFERSA